MYKASFRHFRVSAEYVGNEAAPFNAENYHNHQVVVVNRENRRRMRFMFWASIMKPELCSRYDVLNAFYCFLSDAASGLLSFEEFCREFGYDTDSRTAYRTWQACQYSSRKALRLLDGTESDLYALLNQLSEVAA